MTKRRGRPKTTGTSPKRDFRAPDDAWVPFEATVGKDDKGRSQAPQVLRQFVCWFNWMSPEERETWLEATRDLPERSPAGDAQEAA